MSSPSSQSKSLETLIGLTRCSPCPWDTRWADVRLACWPGPLCLLPTSPRAQRVWPGACAKGRHPAVTGGISSVRSGCRARGVYRGCQSALLSLKGCRSPEATQVLSPRPCPTWEGKAFAGTWRGLPAAERGSIACLPWAASAQSSHHQAGEKRSPTRSGAGWTPSPHASMAPYPSTHPLKAGWSP